MMWSRFSSLCLGGVLPYPKHFRLGAISASVPRGDVEDSRLWSPVEVRVTSPASRPTFSSCQLQGRHANGSLLPIQVRAEILISLEGRALPAVEI